MMTVSLHNNGILIALRFHKILYVSQDRSKSLQARVESSRSSDAERNVNGLTQ